MKTLQRIAMVIVLITLFASCQPSTDVKQILSNSDTRKAIIDTISNDSIMSREMMVALMNGRNGKMLMMENHEAMMKMMKDDPGMMQSMMSGMMETCKSDSTMMCSMCKTMMGNKQMMDMMDNMKEENKDMKKSGSMQKMKGMDNKTKK
jgi:hypothetical protein